MKSVGLALLAKPSILANGGGAGGGFGPDLIQGERRECHSRGQGCVCEPCTPRISASQKVLGEVLQHSLQESSPAETSASALPLCETKHFSGCGTRSQHDGSVLRRSTSQFPELELRARTEVS